jgi:hypothetical protein
MKQPGQMPIDPANEHGMGGPGKKENPPGKIGGKSGQPPPPPCEEDDVEDGDFATPKRDCDDEDDQPL